MEDKSVTFSIRIKESILKKIQEEAEKQDRSANYIIGKALEKHIKGGK